MSSGRRFLLGVGLGVPVGGLLTLVWVGYLMRFDDRAVALLGTVANGSLTVALVAVTWYYAKKAWQEADRANQTATRVEQDRRNAAARRLLGAAWLARRSCEVTLRLGVHFTNPGALAGHFTQGPRLDRLEAQVRQVLALSSIVGGEAAKDGARAFESFLATADQFNAITAFGSDQGEWWRLAEEGLLYLHTAVCHLEGLAPRRAFEPALPDVFTLKAAPLQPPLSPSAMPAQPPTST